jgi:antitoxin ParD1/3/4
MATMNISLPDDMKDFVDAQVTSRGFMTSSEYIRDLIREQCEIAEFRAKVQAGIDSGPGRPADEVMTDLRARVAMFKE